jgi:hypothetical protein
MPHVHLIICCTFLTLTFFLLPKFCPVISFTFCFVRLTFVVIIASSGHSQNFKIFLLSGLLLLCCCWPHCYAFTSVLFWPQSCCATASIANPLKCHSLCIHSYFTVGYLTLCGPVANLLAFGFLNVRTGSQLFGFWGTLCFRALYIALAICFC